MEDQLYKLACTLSGVYPDTESNMMRGFKSYSQKNFSPQTYAKIPFQEFRSESTNTATHGWDAFENHTIFVLQEKRFFITVDGHLGLASSAIEIGDSYCVLFGCVLPLVIRPTAIQGHFKLRGASYIDGAIRGKFVEGVKSASDLTEITLV
jgi:hypothetical protein